jgi:hypothetical protein
MASPAVTNARVVIVTVATAVVRVPTVAVVVMFAVVTVVVRMDAISVVAIALLPRRLSVNPQPRYRRFLRKAAAARARRSCRR